MKKNVTALIISLTIVLSLFACNPQPGQVSLTATSIDEISRTPAPIPSPSSTQEPASFPLSERGPYWTGNRVYSIVDDSRNERKVDIQIYYPALKEANEQGGIITRDATPDMSGAPYPLILTGHD
jgi:hypothetical protein